MASYPRKTANKPPTIALSGQPAKRALSRLHLFASGVDDVARAQPVWPPVPTPISAARPYSAALDAVSGMAVRQQHGHR